MQEKSVNHALDAHKIQAPFLLTIQSNHLDDAE